ncbi:hypothetical protein HF896_00270 (plasmid) [Alicycliphilus denitrificans]|uniref:Uncharacterized protein n=1 Tax=Alicycliphilus denitrificans TaxID=179636 RepID=A0A858ZMY1_9BURK|nr:hypothetical protein [Alicycliphilus denitrificans]QKD42074.1 hypothetical protein HF896_00270 [Alicycliphilus denitrificans]
MNLDRRTLMQLLLGVALFAAAAISSVFLDNYKLQVFTTLAMVCVLCWGWNIVGGYIVEAIPRWPPSPSSVWVHMQEVSLRCRACRSAWRGSAPRWPAWPWRP